MSFNLTDINQRYSFDIYPSQVIGTRFNNVVYLGSVDATGVTGFDPRVQHMIVYPSLPSGTSDRYDSYPYHRFRLPNGVVTFVGDPWVKVNTLVKLDNIRIDVKIGTVSAADADHIKNMLLNNDYTDFSIDVVNL